MNLSSALLAAGRGPERQQRTEHDARSTPTRSAASRAGRCSASPARRTSCRPSRTSSARSGRCATRPRSNSALPPGSPPTAADDRDPRRAPSASRLARARPARMLVSADGGTTTYLRLERQPVEDRPERQHDPARVRSRLQRASRARSAPRCSTSIPQSARLRGADRRRGGHPTRRGPQPLGVHVGDVFALERADGTRTIYVALARRRAADHPAGRRPDPRPSSTSPSSCRWCRRRCCARHRATAHPIDTVALSRRRAGHRRDYPYGVACVLPRRAPRASSTGVFALRRVPVPAERQAGHGHPARPARPSTRSTSIPARAPCSRRRPPQQTSGAARAVRGHRRRRGLPGGRAGRRSPISATPAKDVARTAPELISLLPKGPDARSRRGRALLPADRVVGQRRYRAAVAARSAGP